MLAVAAPDDVRWRRVRDAGWRYQASHHGRRVHAAWQWRYRARQKEMVTHHGSPLPLAAGVPHLISGKASNPCLEGYPTHVSHRYV